MIPSELQKIEMKLDRKNTKLLEELNFSEL